MQLKNQRWDLASLQEQPVVEGHQTEISGFTSGGDALVEFGSSATDRDTGQRTLSLGGGCEREGCLDMGALKKKDQHQS